MKSLRAIIESEDSYDDLKECLAIVDEKLIQPSSILMTVQPHQRAVVAPLYILGGGDMKYGQTVMGMEVGNYRCTDGEFCLWCHCPATQFSSRNQYPPRTLASCFMHAHLTPPGANPFPFTCDGCHKLFTTQEVSFQGNLPD